jgi:UDP-2,4-diacetamido-2,4,6-trideoxy-beta-L-altropyranose hydrolase
VKNVVFRVDSSFEIGAGHVIRCLTLADFLRDNGIDCTFVCREHFGSIHDKIISRGHSLVKLPPIQEPKSCVKTRDTNYDNWVGDSWENDAYSTLKVLRDIGGVQWVILDHYGIDARWEAQVIAGSNKLLVVDDLANRPHICHLLLDQNLGRIPSDYTKFVSENCKLLLGPQFALLRPDFAFWRECGLRRRVKPSVQRLIISMGGIDHANATSIVLEALRNSALSVDCKITVVMGANSPWLDQVRKLAATLSQRVEVHVDVENMAELMVESDLAIGSAGSSSWERCCLGLPCLVVVLADNQIQIASALNEAGAAINLGNILQFQFKDKLEEALTRVCLDQTLLAEMAEKASSIVGGRGAALVADFILSEFIS